MTDEQHEKFNEYLAYQTEANRMRGEILSNSINLERQIDEVLAFYFCENNEPKRNALLGMVLNVGKIGFKAKISILKLISKNLFPDIQEKLYEIIKDINKNIINQRNAIAHRALEKIDFEQSYIEKKTVYKEKNSLDKDFEIDNWDFAQILKSTSDYTSFFIRLNFRMRNTQPTP